MNIFKITVKIVIDRLSKDLKSNRKITCICSSNLLNCRYDMEGQLLVFYRKRSTYRKESSHKTSQTDVWNMYKNK